MGSLLWGTAAALGGLVLLVALLLAIPVTVVFRCRRVGAFSAQFAVGWLFGRIRLRRRWPGLRAAEAGERPPERRSSRHQRGGQRGSALSLLRESDLRRRLLRLLNDLVRAAHLDRLRLRARLGLGDPADTGLLWALVGPLSGAAQGLGAAQVQVQPEWVDPVFEFDAQGRVRFVPLQWLALILWFGLSPSAMRAWWRLRGGHG